MAVLNGKEIRQPHNTCQKKADKHTGHHWEVKAEVLSLEDRYGNTEASQVRTDVVHQAGYLADQVIGLIQWKRHAFRLALIIENGNYPRQCRSRLTCAKSCFGLVQRSVQLLLGIGSIGRQKRLPGTTVRASQTSYCFDPPPAY